MLLKTVYRSSDDTFLVIQKTQLEEGFCLHIRFVLLLSDIEEVFKMFEGLMDVTISLMNLCKLFVCVSSLCLLVSFLAKL
jgi:hypothetical protein